MGALKMALDYVRNNFTKPKRRAGAISRSQIAAGLESLEDRRVLSSNGWTPGLTNFEQESNNTAASATLRRCKTINYRIGIVNIGPKLDTFGYAGSKYSAMDSREVYSDRWGS